MNNPAYFAIQPDQIASGDAYREAIHEASIQKQGMRANVRQHGRKPVYSDWHPSVSGASMASLTLTHLCSTCSLAKRPRD